MSARVSHEALMLARLRDATSAMLGVEYASGMGSGNRFQVQGWNLVGLQQFQFGDLRMETATTTVVIETESAGGVTNLAKYWPYLEARPTKRFILIHLFQVLSANDYVSHLRLWDYLVCRMRDDLGKRCRVQWPDNWEAHRFSYGPALDPTAEVAELVRTRLDG